MLSFWARRLLLFSLALALLAAGFVIGTTVISTTAGPAYQTSVEPIAANKAAGAGENAAGYSPMLELEQVYAEVYNRIGPSVVSINVMAMGSSGFSEGMPAGGTGTGFVIDDQGHIVTNNHVVDGATRIEVNFFDGTIARGEIVGLDPDSDLAVIQVDLPAEQLHPVQFADSSNLFVGQSVIAIGSPFGQRWTMTTGIVSAVDRTIQGLGGYQIGAVIQTDAAINPGNSGGPLLDLSGRVVGVNSQIMSRSQTNSGIGFAIPANLVQRVAQQLITAGSVNYSYLGISSRNGDVDLAMIEALNLPNNTRGVVVAGVEPGGPAATAGLRNPASLIEVEGIPVPSGADIITAIDGRPVTGFSTLIAYLASNTSPGQTVNLTILRDGQELVLPVTLGERPHITR